MERMMVELIVPVAFAAFMWWFSTGIVLLLDGLPRTTFRWSLAISSLLAAAGIGGIALTAHDASVAGAYLGFTCALLVWGWQELAFLTGWITGPRREASDARPGGWRHFVHAIEAILWHELAIIGAGLLIAAITWHAANPVALWTYAVLWIMRSSAKLNLFFGVRNLSEEFLPPHLAYLKSYFRRRRMNALMPLSLGAGGLVVALLVQRALDPAAGAAQAAGLLLVASLLALATLEHLLMVLPLNASALWHWAMRSQSARVIPAPAAAPLAVAPAPVGLPGTLQPAARGPLD
jgi:putative photosynthetic complex assembly protein 2